MITVEQLLSSVDMDPDEQRKLLEQYQDKVCEKWSRVTERMIPHLIPKGRKVDFLKGITDTRKRRLLASLYENAYRWRNSMQEDTRMAHVGSFDKYIFPVIRAAYANLVSQDLVSVQPMNAPTGLVFYFDVLYDNTKGNIKRGDRMFHATSGPSDKVNYANETVYEEEIGTGDGSDADYSGNLAWTPVRPGTVHFTDGDQEVNDDGNGVLCGDCYAGGTIDYQTGAYEFTFLSAPDISDEIVCTYEYIMEASVPPKVKLQLTSSPVVAKKWALSFEWSIEAQQDASAYHAIDIEAELVGFSGNEISKEIDYSILNQLYAGAGAGSVTWYSVPPTGVQWYFHKKQLAYSFIECSSLIFKATQRDQGNWAVCGIEVCNYLKTMKEDGFVETSVPTGTVGIRKIGKLSNIDIYEAPQFAPRVWLMGRKAASVLDCGFVYAPYLGVYTTPTYVLHDLVARKGMAVRAAKKFINRGQYATGEILNEAAPTT